MLHLTPEAAVYLRKLRLGVTTDDAGSHDVLSVAPAAAGEVRGLKLSFVAHPGEGDTVSESQGFYLSVDRELAYELDDKLIDLSPGGESVYIRSA